MKNNTIEHLGSEETIVLTTIYIIFGCLGLFGNVSIVFLVARSRLQRRKFSGVLVLNLAIADFLVCFFSIPYNIFSLLSSLDELYDDELWEYDSLCKLPMFFNFFTAVLRILSLTAMSIDRYIAINYPYLYTRYATNDAFKTQCGFIIGYVWLHALSTIIPAMIDGNFWITFIGANGRLCGVSWMESNLVYVCIITAINFVIPAIVIAVTNFRVFCLARNQIIKQTIRTRATSLANTTYADKTTERRSVFVVRENQNQRRNTIEYSNKSFTRTSPLSIDAEHDRKISQQSNDINLINFNKKMSDLANVQVKEAAKINGDSRTITLGNPSHQEVPHSGFVEARKEQTKRSSKNIRECPSIGIIDTDNRTCNKIESRQGMKIATKCQIHNTSPKKLATAKEGIRCSEHRTLQINESNNNAFLRNELLQRHLYPDSPKRTGSIGNKTPELRQLGDNEKQNDVVSVRKKTQRSSTEWEIALSTLYLVVGYLISYLPFIISRLVIALSPTKLSLQVYAYTTLFTILDSTLTPYIVLATRREFRKTLKGKLRLGKPVQPESRVSRDHRSLTGL